MITGSFKRISPRKFLCSVVAAALGFAPVFCGTLFQVQAQTAPQAATVHVDVTPEHILNTINPDTATGVWMDDLSKTQVDNLSKPETIQGIKNLGWGSITMRNNSELRLSAWHWNENGTWSDPASKSGYYTGSADLGEPIRYGYSYSLPHRDFMTSGDSPLVAGFQSYWKSNPYLTSHFTGESDTLHPQWIVLDLAQPQPVDSMRIAWGEPYATHYLVQYWTGDDPIRAPTRGTWQTFSQATVT